MARKVSKPIHPLRLLRLLEFLFATSVNELHPAVRHRHTGLQRVVVLPFTLLQWNELIPKRYPERYIVVIWIFAEAEPHLRCEPSLLSTVRRSSGRAPRPPGA